MARKRGGRRMAGLPQSAWHWNQRLAKVFGKRIGMRSSLTAASEALGLPVGQMHRVKVHKLGGRPMEMLGGLVAIGDENPPDLYHEALEEIPRNHVAILACSRENQGLEPSAFLIALTPRIRALESAGLEKSGSWRCHLVLIRSLGNERLNDWKQAAVKLEWILGLLLFFVEKKGRRTAAAFADIACALIALAAAYRIGGRRDDANDVLRMTRPLVDLAGLALVEGLWLQKSGYLLVDLNRCDRAYEFIEEAAMCFIAAGATVEQAQSLVDQGYVLSHAKQHEAAIKVLRRAASLLAPADVANKFAVHQLQFVAFRHLGRYPEALEELESALLVAGDLILGKAALYWGRAKLAVLSHDPATAAVDFEAALAIHRKCGKATDVAELTFDYAQLLLSCGSHSKLEQLSSETAEWTAELQGPRKTRQVLENFVALQRLKQLDAASLAEIRGQLSQTKETAPCFRRRKTQPFGGNNSPDSGPVDGANSPTGGNTSPSSGSPAVPTKNEIN